jgi:hypothetical protein
LFLPRKNTRQPELFDESVFSEIEHNTTGANNAPQELLRVKRTRMELTSIGP